MTIPEFLEDLLRRKRLSERSLAMNVGVSPNSINMWRRGLRTPDPEYCARLAAFAGLEDDEVMAMAGHMAAPKAPSPIAPDQELPKWLRQTLGLLRQLDDYEGAIVEELAQGLLRRRDERPGEGDPQ